MEDAVQKLGLSYTDEQVNQLAQRHFENTQVSRQYIQKIHRNLGHPRYLGHSNYFNQLAQRCFENTQVSRQYIQKFSEI